MQNRNQKQSGGLSSFIGEKTPSKTSGLTFTVAACAFFFVSLLLSLIMPTAKEGESLPQWALYLNFLAAPIAFALVVVWYFSYTKNSVKGFLKAQVCPLKYYGIALLMQVGLLSLSELNVLFLAFLKKFGYVDSGITLPSLNGFGFCGVLFAVAVLPAVMEELFFRGIFLQEMKEFSLWGRVLLCGALFALFHQNPAQTIYQFVCGVAFALIAVRAKSIFPTILSHFLNNGYILLMAKLGVESYSPTVYAIILIVSVICLTLALLLLTVWEGKKEKKTERVEGAYKSFFLCAGIGVFVFSLSWLLGLLVGFM